MPTFELTGPDGGKYQLDAPDETAALSAFTSLHGGKSGVPVSVDNVMRSVEHGIPVFGGVVDKFAAGMDALTHGLLGRGADGDTIGDRYDKNIAAEDARTQGFEAAHPNVDLAAKIGGGIAGTAALIAAAPAAFGAGGSVVSGAARGALSGAGLSAADAAFRGEDPLKAAALGAGLGATGVTAGRAIGAGIESVLNNSATKAANLAPIARAAENLGVDFPKVAASDSLVTQRVGSALKELPVIGDPIVKASIKASQQMGDALKGVEQGYGSGSVLNAGDVAKTGLTDWITGGSKNVMSRLYSGVDNLVDPAVTRDLDATRGVVSKILADRQQAGMNGPSKAVDLVMDAVQRPGGLNYNGTKDLRTSIGEMLDNNLLPADISKSELRRVYGGLTNDLKGVVTDAGGPPALSAFNRANTLNALVSQKREALAKIVGSEGQAAPEQVLDRLIGMASTSSREDFNKLALARKTIGPQNWNEVASAAVSRIGRDADGNFSPARFLTAYGKISPNGKQQLFGSTGKDNLVSALEDIATLSRRAQGLTAYGNPSGTGRVLGGIEGVKLGVTNPAVALPIMAGARMVASHLAKPIRPSASTIRTAAQNSNVARLLESVIGGGSIAATPPVVGQSNVPLRIPPPLQPAIQ